MSLLPIISKEQQEIIEHLKNNKNVMVDSVAGSGKTTCILHTSLSFENLQILSLTYNSKLKIETREKIYKMKITNMEVHSYHSFCVKYYDPTCFTDSEITKINKNNIEKLKNFSYDVIILDESQDITPIYFQLICKIFKDNSIKTPKICILGDEKQSIFDFNNADKRFITLADKIFRFNNYEWVKCKLSRSFRITYEMSDFINICMIKEERIVSYKVSDNKPRYIICNCFGENSGFNKIFHELTYYLDLGYLPQDIFILAPSIQNKSSPIRILENKIKKEIPNIPIFIPMGDDSKIDNDILENKLVFSTFHQVKGLERKVVLITSFDSCYFKYFKKNVNKYECPNELYVATTRASERLSVFHHYENYFLDFIDETLIRTYCDLIEHRPIILKDDFLNNSSSKTIGVCDLIKHLPNEIIDGCCDFLSFKTIKEKGIKIDIPIKTQQDDLFEEVSEITGLAIPIFLDYKINESMTVLNHLRNNNELISIFNKEHKENFSTISLETLIPQDLLKIATCWNSYKTGFLFKIYQIKKYDWLSEENFELSIERLNRFNFKMGTRFECEYKISHKLLKKKDLVGYIDCIFKNNIYEFKCCSELKKEHYIQLAVYKYLYEKSLDNNNTTNTTNTTTNINKLSAKEKNNYYLYNILTDELLLLNTKIEDIENMMDYLIFNKYKLPTYIEDDIFLLNAQNILNQYQHFN